MKRFTLGRKLIPHKTKRKDLALELLFFSLNQNKTHLKTKAFRGFRIN